MSDLNGTYSSPSCPSFTIKNGQITDGQQSYKFDLTNIKGDNLLVTNPTPFFVHGEATCSLLFKPSARYLLVAGRLGGIEIELSSADLQLSRRFRKQP